VREKLTHPAVRVARIALLCAVLVFAPYAAVASLEAWRLPDSGAHARAAFAAVEAGAAHESLVLRSTAAGRGADVGAFRSAAKAERQLIAEAGAETPDQQQPLVVRMEASHGAAVYSAERSLRSEVDSSVARERAFRFLADLRLTATRAETQIQRGAGVWPATPIQHLELADLAFVALLGLIALVRQVLRSAGLSQRTPWHSSELERLTHVARTDSLTGLGNHRAFQDDLSTAIEQRNAAGTPFSLLAFDLDGLKQMNDQDGHPAGDAYIRTVAYTIRDTLGSQGVVYRTGGDEFMAILPDARGWHALTLAHAIQRASSHRTGRRALSIGITESTKTEARKLLMHQADLALYEAKRAKLLAVSYHPGLEPRESTGGATGPTQHQKALAAALAQAVDAKDAGTRNHSETVAELCAAVGQRLGISGERLERLRIAGLLHDVGKIGVPDAVLLKRGSLAPDERSEVELHTTVGHSILTSAALHEEAVWVLHHHERFDGTGYPTGLAADAIPLESRIISVADAFEAMTGSRPYRSAMSPEEALSELATNCGSQFDAACVEALNQVFGGAARQPVHVAKPVATSQAAAAAIA
jgi:diguanylate cyclase (GGDEF)-like protein